MAKRAWKDHKAAGHIVFEIRKQSDACWCPSQSMGQCCPELTSFLFIWTFLQSLLEIYLEVCFLEILNPVQLSMTFNHHIIYSLVGALLEEKAMYYILTLSSHSYRFVMTILLCWCLGEKKSGDTKNLLPVKIYVPYKIGWVNYYEMCLFGFEYYSIHYLLCGSGQVVWFKSQWLWKWGRNNSSIDLRTGKDPAWFMIVISKWLVVETAVIIAQNRSRKAKQPWINRNQQVVIPIGPWNSKAKSFSIFIHCFIILIKIRRFACDICALHTYWSAILLRILYIHTVFFDQPFPTISS